MQDWGDFTNFALALYNTKELYTADQVINFFVNLTYTHDNLYYGMN